MWVTDSIDDPLGPRSVPSFSWMISILPVGKSCAAVAVQISRFLTVKSSHHATTSAWGLVQDKIFQILSLPPNPHASAPVSIKTSLVCKLVRQFYFLTISIFALCSYGQLNVYDLHNNPKSFPCLVILISLEHCYFLSGRSFPNISCLQTFQVFLSISHIMLFLIAWGIWIDRMLILFFRFIFLIVIGLLNTSSVV